MLRIFLITIIAFFYTASLFADNENNRILTLEEINADLEAKKKDLEPFDSNEVKIDLESLGLDDVTKKEDVKEKIEEIAEEKTEDKLPIAKETTMEKTIPNGEVATGIVEDKALEEDPKPAQKIEVIEEVKEESKTSESEPNQGIMSRIKSILNSDPVKETKVEKVEVQGENKVEDVAKPEEPQAQKQFINGKKRESLKKRKALEKQRKENEKREKERLKQLNELRIRYLNYSNESPEEDLTLNYLDSSENITPQKKGLNKFLIEEPPAMPILGTYRTQDNLHIPLVMTPKERIDILFATISIDSISAFNDAYAYIKNPNARNDFGDTILTYSILSRKYPMMISILSKGADPNMPNKLGYTPVNIALELQDFKALEILVNNKADLEYIDAFGRNYLMHAARIGILSAAKLFVDRGIDVNAIDNQGATALAIAYQSGQNIIATFLLKNGAKSSTQRPYNPEEYSIIKELENSWK